MVYKFRAVTVSPLLTTVGYGRIFNKYRGYGRFTAFPITAHEALPSSTLRQCMCATLVMTSCVDGILHEGACYKLKLLSYFQC
jgi:hypothetical protein